MQRCGEICCSIMRLRIFGLTFGGFHSKLFWWEVSWDGG